MLALKIGLVWLALSVLVVFFMYCCSVVSNCDPERRTHRRRNVLMRERNDAATLERRRPLGAAGSSYLRRR